MPSVRKVKLSEVVLAVQRMLQASEEDVPPTQVVLSQRDDFETVPPAGLAEQAIVVHVGGLSPDQPQNEGAGRVDFRVRRRLDVVAWTRIGLDEINTDLLLLTTDSVGLLDLEHSILEALQDKTPTDDDGNDLLSSRCVCCPAVPQEVLGMTLHGA